MIISKGDLPFRLLNFKFTKYWLLQFSPFSSPFIWELGQICLVENYYLYFNNNDKRNIKTIFSQPHFPIHDFAPLIILFHLFQSSFGLSISSSATVAKSYTEANCKTDFLVVKSSLFVIQNNEITKLSKIKGRKEFNIFV